MINIDYASLLADVKENRRLLDNCPKHHFPTVTIALGVKAVCSKCGGAMDVLEVSQYVRGYVAAGGDPNDVMPGWNDPMPPDWKPLT